MNPRAKALKVFEQQAIAMRNMEDPISSIEMAIWATWNEAMSEAADKCLEIQGDGLSQEIQDYNHGCEDCARAITILKGKLSL